jgi:hypothetical protein
MTVAATDLRRSPARIEDDQNVVRRRGRDSFQAVGLLVGILSVLFLLAATVGAASPADLTSAVETGSSAAAQQEGGAPVLDWYRISDSNR